MRRFLRYNARHSLWFPRGWGGQWLPRLNPLVSSSHNDQGRRTLTLDEPLWLFRLRQWFNVTGRHRCGRRLDPVFDADHREFPDTWDLGPDGNRTCSYCGSIHPDDLMVICAKTLTDRRYGVEGTDKSYKLYVRQPGVRNAGQGAIKFYQCHVPDHPRQAEQNLLDAAMRATRERDLRRG